MRRLEDIRAANAVRPDYIGFVFAEKSKRYVTQEQARMLREALTEGIQTVGVFVDAPIETIRELYTAGVIGIAQLHGREDQAYITRLREAVPELSVIQAIQVKTESDLKRARESQADYLLLDSGAGSGETFAWEWLRDFPRPYFLAGGLDVGNVGLAVRELHPFGVDVSSGIETDGMKDPEKMAEFVRKAREG